MATNWTDLVLFTVGDIVLPSMLGSLDPAVVTNYHDAVKRDFERIIINKWIDSGKLTAKTTDDFDIEEIENGDILHDTALRYNYVLIAENEATNLSDLSDVFASFYDRQLENTKERMKMDAGQLTFASPEGINELSPQFTWTKS